jgi:hypothetical protein
MSNPRVRMLIRTDGTTQVFDKPVPFDEIRRLIGADTMDTVALHHMGRPLHVMMVDDMGYETKAVVDGNTTHLVPVRALKPVNLKATELYHANCMPGTLHQIVGDVLVVPDEDFI